MFNLKKIHELERQICLIRLDLQSIQDILKENNIEGNYSYFSYRKKGSLVGQKINAILDFLKLDAKEEHSASRVFLTKQKKNENINVTR